MSKIIQNAITGSTAVYIGERNLDHTMEEHAAKKLAQLFPPVAIVTDPSGARFIPIQEVFLMDQLHREAVERVRREAYELGSTTGYARGRAEGLDEGLAESRQTLAAFGQAAADVLEQRKAILDEARRNVVDLILMAAQKVTYRALDLDPELIVRLISGVINELADKSRLKIKVNPAHVAIVEQGIDRFLRGSTAIKEIRVEADPRVRAGGCFIETPTGDIDARLESQFEVIRDLLEVDSGDEP